MSSPTFTVPQHKRRWLSQLADYAQLTRPRIAVMNLVVVAVAGYVAAEGSPDWRELGLTLVGTFLVAASAISGNQLLERERDRLMPRTARRPLPTGRVSFGQALVFMSLTVVAGVTLLACTVNWLTALWGALAWGLYVGVYTPLKSRTSWSTTVGALAGALPMLMGWSGVGGTLNVLADPRGWALFLIHFLWQFPHFMAIAWIYREQYERAGMKMLTVIDPTGRRAGLQAILTAVAVLPISLVPLLVGPGHLPTWYLVAAVLLGFLQIGYAVHFSAQRTDRSARQLLRVTLIYLPTLLVVLVLATL